MTLPVVERSLPSDLPERLSEVGDRPIGTGSTSHVYPATLLPGGVRVVLKLEAHAGAWRVDEAAIAEAVRSPYLVQVIEQLTFADGRRGLVLQRRAVLSERIRKRDVSTWEALCWMRDVARGLADLHRAGLVHRDLCPSNVLVGCEPGQPPRAWVGDLGSAGPPSSRPDQPLVDPDYRAREIVDGPGSSQASDVFALGAICGELARGLPWSIRTRTLREIAARTSADDPGHRPSAAAAAALLERSLSWRRELAIAAAAAALAAGVAVVLGSRPADQPPSPTPPLRSAAEIAPPTDARVEPVAAPRAAVPTRKRPAAVLRTRPTFPEQASPPTRTMDPSP